MLKIRLAGILLIGCLLLTACAGNPAPSPSLSPSPTVTASPAASPEPTRASAMELKEEPVLEVYIVSDGQTKSMGIEEYLQGVLAGEMKNDWPMEALKAQAIIARTFVERFMMEHESSKYENADISTDIEEAQAYDPEGINERIKSAIEETRGMVITYDGEPAYTWFHSHAGGKTALATEGLDYEDGDPPYIQPVDSTESSQAPEDVQNWSATFTKQQIIDAAAAMGITINDVSGFEIAEVGPSGRAVLFACDGQELKAATLRVNLDAMEMKSTLLDTVTSDGSSVTFTGRGYGHGVGMSQWGAYEMAEQGSTAEDIIMHYYQDVEIQQSWK